MIDKLIEGNTCPSETPGGAYDSAAAVDHGNRKGEDWMERIESTRSCSQAVNRLKDHPKYGEIARELVDEWKKTARRSGLMENKEVRDSSDSSF